MVRMLTMVAMSLALFGCSQRGPEMIPVSGKVNLDGQPVSGAGVLFVPADGPAASGTTDATGQYKLASGDREGAIPGDHRVAITLQKTSGVSTDEGGLSGEVAPGGIKTEWIVPQKYSKPDTSGLSAKVSSENREINFELKSK